MNTEARSGDEEPDGGSPAAGCYRPLTVERLSPGPYLRYGLGCMALWLAVAWFLASTVIDWRAADATAQAEKEARQSIDDIGLGIQRSLTVFHGIPAAIGRDAAIHRALTHFIGRTGPSPLPLDERRRLWNADADLAAVNRSLGGSTNDIRAISVIWVINPAGDCIAASNSDKPESFVGFHYGDRDYFRQAMAGTLGHQFALGRATNIPGLFFSAPVVEDGEVIGVVAAKIDLPFLSSWVNQANAFITDNFGVIILAQDKRLEMRAIPNAAVLSLPPEQQIGRYKRDNFTALSIVPWPPPSHPALFRVDGGAVPLLMSSIAIPEDDLSVTVMQPVHQIATFARDRLGLFASLAGGGIIAIAAVGASLFFAGSVERRRRYRATRERIEYLANHDVLTGLFSRAVLDQMIEHGIASARRTHRRLGILFVDLDQFKDINDTMGHDVGDLVLQQAANRLRAAMRGVDVIVRQGGDEFVVLLYDITNADDASQVAVKILSRLSEPFLAAGTSLGLSASIGIALYPDDGETPSLLLRRADIAMYRAKEAGRADFRFFAQDGEAA